MFTIIDINKIIQETSENEFNSESITTENCKVDNPNEDKTKHRQKPEVLGEILTKEIPREIQCGNISDSIVKTQEEQVIKEEVQKNLDAEIKYKFVEQNVQDQTADNYDIIYVKSELYNDAFLNETDNNEDPVKPTTSKMSPPKKRKRLNVGHLSVGEQQCIVNMYKDFSNDVPKMNTVAIVNKIATTEGIAKSTVYRIIKMYKETGKVTESKRGGGRPNLMNTYDDYTTSSVRRIINSFVNKNETPTVDKILSEIRNRKDLPQMSRSSLYRFMKKIDFK